jgi:hypothetical protein
MCSSFFIHPSWAVTTCAGLTGPGRQVDTEELPVSGTGELGSTTSQPVAWDKLHVSESQFD